jgi:hypothetical protein
MTSPPFSHGETSPEWPQPGGGRPARALAEPRSCSAPGFLAARLWRVTDRSSTGQGSARIAAERDTAETHEVAEPASPAVSSFASPLPPRNRQDPSEWPSKPARRHGRPAGARAAGETVALSPAGRGVRAVVLRLAPVVNDGVRRGLAACWPTSPKRTGVSGYLADGSQRWLAVHRQDAARLGRLAAERALTGRSSTASARKASRSGRSPNASPATSACRPDENARRLLHRQGNPACRRRETPTPLARARTVPRSRLSQPLANAC